MRSRFSGVKDCQKVGGAGKAAVRVFGAAGSSIVAILLSYYRGEKLEVRNL
jgi:hypothetical protein